MNNRAQPTTGRAPGKGEKPVMQSEHCRFCGASDEEALLGASIRWFGGRGNLEYTHCADAAACQKREDEKNGLPEEIRQTA